MKQKSIVVLAMVLVATLAVGTVAANNSANGGTFSAVWDAINALTAQVQTLQTQVQDILSAPPRAFFIGGGTGAFGPSNSQTSYLTVFDGAFALDEITAQQQVPVSGTLSNLYVATGGAPISGYYVITVRKNGADTAVTCTVSGGARNCADAADSATFAAGDFISLSLVPVDNPNVQSFRWTAKFQ